MKESIVTEEAVSANNTGGRIAFDDTVAIFDIDVFARKTFIIWCDLLIYL